MNQQHTTAVVVTAAVVGLSWLYFHRKRQDKLHIEYEHPPLPLPIRIVAKLPEFLRRPIIIKMQAPKPPLDGIDLIGPDYNPYTIKELEPNKIWRVRYRYICDPALTAALKDMCGIDLCDKSAVEKIDDVNIRKHVEKHIENMKALKAHNEGLESKQQQLNMLQAGLEDSQDMLVARLADDSLLLYNPCRMHPFVVDFVTKLGDVSFIVSGSSVHTNQLPQTAKIFENAKIICAEAANLKCQVVGMRKADYLYTDHKEDSDNGFRSAFALLKVLGIHLHHIEGDVQTQSLLLTIHDHLFDVDLTCYGNGKQCLHVDESDWKNPTPALSFAQTIHYAGTQDSAIVGYLPNYRLMSMDPGSALTKFNLDAPTGTSCRQMAQSLRELLKLPFKYVDNVHSKKKDSLSAADFIDCVENSWNWLDGKTLVEK